jgi:hypothetical protein
VIIVGQNATVHPTLSHRMLTPRRRRTQACGPERALGLA